MNKHQKNISLEPKVHKHWAKKNRSEKTKERKQKRSIIFDSLTCELFF